MDEIVSVQGASTLLLTIQGLILIIVDESYLLGRDVKKSYWDAESLIEERLSLGLEWLF